MHCLSISRTKNSTFSAVFIRISFLCSFLLVHFYNATIFDFLGEMDKNCDLSDSSSDQKTKLIAQYFIRNFLRQIYNEPNITEIDYKEKSYELDSERTYMSSNTLNLTR